MQGFLQRHGLKIPGMLSGFDRIRQRYLKGFANREAPVRRIRDEQGLGATGLIAVLSASKGYL